MCRRSIAIILIALGKAHAKALDEMRRLFEIGFPGTRQG